MVEQNKSLVPLDIENLPEGLNLSPVQKKVIQDFAMQYLRREGFRFDKQNLGRAFDVIVNDAIPRGVVLENSNDLTSQAKLKQVIKRGIAERADIRSKAEDSLGGVQGIKEIIASNLGSVFGNYALSISEVKFVISALSSFALTSDIKNIEDFLKSFNKRKTLLPKMAKDIIAKMPQELFPEASIDRFPMASEQAKIVRNSLVSVAFREIPLPYLRVEEMEQFAKDPQIQEKLNSEVVEKFLQYFPGSEMNSEDGKSYLKDMLEFAKASVTTTRWNRKTSMPGVINSRDTIYIALSKDFLLMHPALEERPLVTDPRQYTPDEYSIWREDLSVVIEGFRIPKVDALQRAIRLASAKGYSAPSFRAATQAWRDYEASRVKEEKAKQILEEEIAGDRRLLAELNEGKGDVPAHIKNMFGGATFDAEYNFRRTIVENFRNVRAHIRAKSISAKEYIENLKKENNGEIPDKAVVPASEVVRAKGGKKSSWERKRARGIEVLDEDFLAREWMEETGIDLWDRLTNDQLSYIISQTEVKLEDAKNDKIPYEELPSPSEIADFLINYIEQIERKSRTNTRRTRYIPIGYKERYEKLGKLYSQFNELEKNKPISTKDTRNFQKDFYIYSLENRLNALSDIRDAIVKKRELNLEEYRVYWTKEQILSWAKVAQVANFDVDKYDMEALQNLWKEAIDWKHKFENKNYRDKRDVVPRVLPGREEFEKYLENLALGLASIDEGKTTPQKALTFRGNKEVLLLLKELLEISSNPLIPFEEMKGENFADFIKCLGLRLDLTRATKALPVAEQEFEKAKEEFMSYARIFYAKELEGRLKRANKELSELKEEPSKRHFLDKLRSLKLLVEVNQPE